MSIFTKIPLSDAQLEVMSRVRDYPIVNFNIGYSNNLLLISTSEICYLVIFVISIHNMNVNFTHRYSLYDKFGENHFKLGLR